MGRYLLDMQLRKSFFLLVAPLLSLAAASTWMGCGDDDSSTPGAADAGMSPVADAAPAPAADTGVVDSGTLDAGNPLAITLGGGGAAYDAWTWIPVAGTQCADGSPTGIGINPHAGATSLTVYFEGGGACWTDGTCQAGLAANLDGFGATKFATAASSTLPKYALFDRTDAQNPLANESFIYVPYCTADIHVGNNVATYTINNASTQIHHVGYVNAQKDLAVLQATFPGVARLVVTGSSAGGYGAVFNYEQFHLGFPAATPFLLDDSGPPLPNDLAGYEAQNAAWKHFANLPAGCTNCRPAQDDGGVVSGGALGNLIKYYTAEPSFRGSLIETDHDNTISAFFNIPLGDERNSGCVAPGGGIGAGPCDFTTALGSVYSSFIVPGTVTGPGQMHALIRHDTFHTFLGGSAQGKNPQYDTALKAFIASQLGVAGSGTWQDSTPF